MRTEGGQGTREGVTREDASVFGLESAEGWSCHPWVGEGITQSKVGGGESDFNFQHTEIEISQRPPNGDEEMPHSSWRSKSGVWGDVWARIEREELSVFRHVGSVRFPMEHI